MDELFIEIEISTVDNETEIFTSVQSFIALYVYRFLGTSPKICLRLVNSKLRPNVGKLKLRSEMLRNELTEERILCKSAATNEAIRDLCMPIYARANERTYIAGMCAVCRELVARQDCAERRKLLGFKEGCLLAPAETSIWTRFCEVNVVSALNRLLLAARGIGEPIEDMPQEVSRFERHMNEPVRMHNIYKLAREQAKCEKRGKQKVLINSSTPKESLPLEHRFAEGVIFTIADLILYPCFRIIFQCCSNMLLHFPLISTWLNEIDNFDPSCQRLLQQLHLNVMINAAQGRHLKVLDSEPLSLYKSDPKRYKPRHRLYTVQEDVDKALAKLQTLPLEFRSDSSEVFDQANIDWNVIEPQHETSSALPQERLKRKRQQLENMANAVQKLAFAGNRIVDFCSGTGHLGILLALQLPYCSVIIMENKATSLQRAKQRATELKLNNCIFYQCNVDYFEGAFDLGTALHACGTATDVVLQQCRRALAKFVCCPCCYGALQPMPHISYPLSNRLRAALSEKEYMYIAHTADQSHELGATKCKPELTLQGQFCMDIIDTDRKLQATEAGYSVLLTRLKPEQCTPKNRLLVGWRPFSALHES